MIESAQFMTADDMSVNAIIDGLFCGGINLTVKSELSDKVNAWIAAGNLPSAYVAPPPVVPDEITNFQMRATLMSQPSATQGKTLFDDVAAWVQTQGAEVIAAFEYANTVSRNGMFVNAAKQVFGWTDTQLNDWFTFGAKINV